MTKNEKKKLKRRTKIGLIKQIYYNQKNHSKNRKHSMPSYSIDWLINWMVSNPEFHRLYDIWVLNEYKKDLVPSVDRIDDYLGYTEYNIQLMTWGENKRKGELDKTKGINNKNNKAVVQTDEWGDIVAEYHSIAEAKRKTKISHISECCKGKLPTAGGYYWNYKG